MNVRVNDQIVRPDRAVISNFGLERFSFVTEMLLRNATINFQKKNLRFSAEHKQNGTFKWQNYFRHFWYTWSPMVIAYVARNYAALSTEYCPNLGTFPVRPLSEKFCFNCLSDPSAVSKIPTPNRIYDFQTQYDLEFIPTRNFLCTVNNHLGHIPRIPLKMCRGQISRAKNNRKINFITKHIGVAKKRHQTTMVQYTRRRPKSMVPNYKVASSLNRLASVTSGTTNKLPFATKKTEDQTFDPYANELHITHQNCFKCRMQILYLELKR